jgi:hypothetical protein
VLARVLQPEETLLWSGQPDHRRLFAYSDRYLVPISLVLLVVCLPNLSINSVVPGFIGALVVFLYLMVVLVVLYVLAGRFYYKRTTRRCTYYGVTTTRVLSLNTLWGARVRSFDLGDGLVVRTEGGPNCGTVLFSSSRDLSAWGESTGLPSLSVLRTHGVPALYDIARPDEVCELIRSRGAGPKSV